MVTDIPISFIDRLGHVRHRGRVEDIRPRGAFGRHDLRRLVVPGGQQDNLGQERGHHALVARECPQQGGEKLSFSQCSLASFKSSVIPRTGYRVTVSSELVVSRRDSVHACNGWTIKVSFML